MKTSTKAIGAIAALGIGAALVADLVDREARDLELLSSRAGLAVDCEIRELEGEKWGACRYHNGALASLWLKRGETWSTANGAAIAVVERLASVPAEQLRGLPAAAHDRRSQPMPPDALLQ